MPIPGWVEQIGQGTASNAVDSVLGLVTGGAWNKMQRKNQKKQQAIQIAGQKEMTDYAMGKQLEMWKNTSYAAQKEQMELAGLNPGLMYGMGGGGGQTTGSGAASVSGPSGGGMPHVASSAGMGMQLQMTQAQKENVEADTELKKATAAKTAGVDTTAVESSIAKMAAETTNEELKAALLKADATMKGIQNEVAGETKQDMKYKIMWESKRALEELEQAQVKTDVSQETVEEQKTLIRAAAIGALLENQSKRLNLQVDQKKLEMLAQQIASLKITTGLASSEQAIQIQKMVHETTGIKDDDSKGIIGDILKMIKF